MFIKNYNSYKETDNVHALFDLRTIDLICASLCYCEKCVISYEDDIEDVKRVRKLKDEAIKMFNKMVEGDYDNET